MADYQAQIERCNEDFADKEDILDNQRFRQISPRNEICRLLKFCDCLLANKYTNQPHNSTFFHRL